MRFVTTASLMIALAFFLGQCTAEQKAAKKNPFTAGDGVMEKSEPSDSTVNGDGDSSKNSNGENSENDSADQGVDQEEPNAPAQLEAGTFPAKWIHGSQNCGDNTDPPLQVHKYNESLYILRQNKCLNFEGPFLYLLFGKDKALLIDTGATNNAQTFPLRTRVEELITTWLKGTPRANYQLIVIHTHGHGDHRAADPQFQNQAGTVLVPANVTQLESFLQVTDWPNQNAKYDLGGRPLHIVPLPGHEPNHLAIYDERSGLLFTGDTLYPGRLYVADWETYRASIQRLLAFAAPKTVTHILGAHIEMTATPGQDYQIGTTFQPNEPPLEMKKTHLEELNKALQAIGPTPRREVHDLFIISPN